MIERPVTENINQNGKVVSIVRYLREVRSEQLTVDTNLEELDLPADENGRLY